MMVTTDNNDNNHHNDMTMEVKYQVYASIKSQAYYTSIPVC